MARCWTCGSDYAGGTFGHFLTCPLCENVKEMKDLRREASLGLKELAQIQQRGFEEASLGFDELAQIQQEGFEKLSNELSRVASVIEWGFTEIEWNLQRHEAILSSIDHTLKTPNETQGNEFRKMAEELRARGVLDESERRFLKALELNPLDYRIYVGLALTYLQMGKFHAGRTFLEKSLPHVPKVIRVIEKKQTKLVVSEDTDEEDEETESEYISEDADEEDEETESEYISGGIETPTGFDLRSYSYRLIGRTHFCDESYTKAVEALNKSIELSPDYYEGYYDHAQYCALAGQEHECITSLRKAILGRPFYFYFSQKERNFDQIRDVIQNLLTEQKNENLQIAKKAISGAESSLEETRKSVNKARESLKKSRGESSLQCEEIFWNAQVLSKLALEKVATDDYMKLLEAKHLAHKSWDEAIKARNTADEERKRLEDEAIKERAKAEEERKHREYVNSERIKKRNNHLTRVVFWAVVISIIIAMITNFATNTTGFPWLAFILSLIIATTIGLYLIRKEL